MNKIAKAGKWKGFSVGIFSVGILFILLVYYSSDLVTMGILLNSLTPWGSYCGGGTVLWIVLLWFFYRIFIAPVLEFRRLKSASSNKSTSLDVRYKSAMADLLPYRERKKEGEKQRDLYHKMNLSGLSSKQKEEHLNEYFKIGDLPKKSKKMIMKYSIAAGTLTAFNRNKLIDALIVLMMQVRLIVDISRLHGYKASPVFNTCCFIWVCSNSLLSLFLQDAADQVGEFVSDGVDEIVGSIGEIGDELVSSSMEGQAMETGAESAVSALADVVNSLTFGLANTLLKVPAKLAGYMSRLAFEAAANGAVVYGTGTLFLKMLEGVSNPDLTNMMALLQFRREGRRKLFKELIMKCVPDEKSKSDISKKDKEEMNKEFENLRSTLEEKRRCI